MIPAAFLWPDLVQYPTQPESGPWPTLLQSDGSDLDEARAAAAATAAGPAPGSAPPTAVAAPPATPGPAAAPTPAAAGPGTALAPRAVLPALAAPRGAAADAAGNLYVFTGDDSRLHKFGPDGKALADWPVVDAAGKALIEGAAVVVLGDQVGVLDATTSTLIRFTLSGEAAGTTQLCSCYFPRGLAVARDGNLWVADTGQAHVLKVTPDGKLLQTIGGQGNAPGQFVEPASVWESPQGTLYVADIGNARVQSFDAQGAPLAAWPAGASVARDGNRLAGDARGQVLVAEVAAGAVVRYDAQGHETGRWTYAPQGTPLAPAGIAPAGGDSFLVLYLQDGRAALFTPGAP